MSIVACKYRIATDEEVKKFIKDIQSNEFNPISKLNTNSISFMEWHNRGQGNFSNTLDYNNSYKKLADKYDLFITIPEYSTSWKIVTIHKYLKLVFVDESWYQGWFMKSGWGNHRSTDCLFDNLNRFNKYCLKYMNLKCGYASEIINYFNDTFKSGEFIEIAW